MERLAVGLTVRADEAELVADELFSLGASAVAESPAPDGDGVVLVADLEPGAVADLRRPWRSLEPERVWTAGWREHARAWRAGPFLVRPPWLPSPSEPGDGAPGPVELVVDPGDAFGSGSHPTTRLCLEAVARLVTPGCRVLDVGCGSGVLAVAAAVLGAGPVVAVDVDPAAVEATRRVARANGVGDSVEVRPVDGSSGTPSWAPGGTGADAGPAGSPGVHDLVLANLLVGVVEDLGAMLAAAAAPGGAVVVSGLLAGTGQVERAVAAVGLEVGAVEELDGWAAVTLRAPATQGSRPTLRVGPDPKFPPVAVRARPARPSRTPPGP